MRCLVTGCAGFIGSALTERLLETGHEVIGCDDFSTGREAHLAHARLQRRFRLVRSDVRDLPLLVESLSGVELVFHLAGHADVRSGPAQPELDLAQNTWATQRVLEAMRRAGVRRIAFTSSGSVYGDAPLVPTPEDAPFPVQTSLYGASKAAAEGFITAYAAAFGFQCYLFRLVSVLGERYGHGHVLDFQRQLAADPRRLRVLGNGRQRKSYLYVQDCIAAMLTVIARAQAALNIYNVGHDEACEVRDSVRWICEALGVTPEIEYGEQDRGWVGDSPLILLDTRRLKALGWRPTLSIRASVLRTLAYLTGSRAEAAA